VRHKPIAQCSITVMCGGWLYRAHELGMKLSKATYSIIVVHENREEDYRNFWERGITVNSDGEDLHSELMGFEEIVEAKNLNEARTIKRENSAKMG